MATSSILAKIFLVNNERLMISRLLLFVTGCLLGFATLAQQPVHAQIVVEKIPGANFSFTKKWDYRFDIIKLENGKFSKTSDGEIVPADTAHLHYTANCQNNVQGLNTVNYCFAFKRKQELLLIFKGSLPAYGTKFDQQIKDGKLTFTPGIVYEEYVKGQKIRYTIIYNTLSFNQKNYLTAKEISGYTNTVFEEIVTMPNKKPAVTRYYLRGYFKTQVKSE